MSWANAGEQPKTLLDTALLPQASPSAELDLIPANLNTGMFYFGGSLQKKLVENGECLRVVVSLNKPNKNPDPADMYFYNFIGSANNGPYYVECSGYIPSPNMIVTVSTANVTNVAHVPGNLSCSLVVVKFS